jgi:predicted amidohydrolase/membrane associated rhomboid family serine protease
MQNNAAHSIREELHGVLLFVGVIWAAFAVRLVFPAVKDFGVVPRTPLGLVGIPAMPFLHADLGHVLGNTVPLVVLLSLLAGSRARSWRIVAGVVLLGGLFLWIFGRTANHIGASGLIFGLISFLIVAGFLEKRTVPLLISLLVGFLYGGTLLWGILPRLGSEVSWDGHLAGAVAGAVVAYALTRPGRGRPAALSTMLLALAAIAAQAAAQQPVGVKVAAVQISGYDKTDVPRAGYDPAAAVIPYVEKAAADAAGLVVFPEYVLGRIAVPGPETRSISAAAAAGRIYVVIGCWEVFDDGTFANTALLFDREGRIAGKYHKTHAAVDHYQGDPPWSRPPSGKDADWFVRNDPEWIMQKGDDLPLFELDFATIGILTCYDGWFPESFRVLSLKGAEILVWINGRRGSVEDFIARSVTFQSHVALVATNQAYGSGTMIADWPARILARAPDREEAYLTATIDLDQLRRARNSSRNFQQRRPDLYGEIVKPR